MSNLIKFELDRSGVRELMKDPGVVGECAKIASAAYARLGEGYVMESRTYPERHGYALYPETREAEKDNLDNNSLLKAVGGG